MKRPIALVAVAVASPIAVLAGCGDDGGETVDVSLSEFSIEPDKDSVDAGEVTFALDNQGGETHEFLVVEAASADDLPVDEDGAFDEEAFGEENVVDEVEDLESGATEDLTVDLDAGDYVLLCNLVEEEETGEVESHFVEGMHATFTVE